jgi:hypothetical protein
MKNFITKFIFFFITLTGFSQNTTTISGYVKGKSEEPIKGVNIVLEKTQLTAITDSLGYFKISNVNTQVTDFFHQSQNLYLSKYLYNGFYEQIFVKRFGYHNLDPNFSAILLLILFQIIIFILLIKY